LKTEYDCRGVPPCHRKPLDVKGNEHSTSDIVKVQRYYEDGRWQWNHFEKLEFYKKNSMDVVATEPEKLSAIDLRGFTFINAGNGVFKYNTQKIIRSETGWRYEDKHRNYEVYDNDGKILEQGTPARKIVTFAYDNATKLLSGAFDQTGKQIIWYEYDQKGQITAVSDYDAKNSDPSVSASEKHRTEYVCVTPELKPQTQRQAVPVTTFATYLGSDHLINI
jgi:YD repeat-containing protein